MSETLLALLPVYGPPFLGLMVGLSCLGFPIPAALAMIAAGAFAAGGDMSIFWVVVASFLGAVAGDQAGFAIGRAFRDPLDRFFSRRPAQAARRDRALAYTERWGWLAVFLSRWLASPICAPVNLASGTGLVSWPRFSAASIAGEAIWVGIYAGLGYAFPAGIAMLADMAADVLWLIAAAFVAVFLGLRVRRALRRTN